MNTAEVLTPLPKLVPDEFDNDDHSAAALGRDLSTFDSKTFYRTVVKEYFLIIMMHNEG